MSSPRLAIPPNWREASMAAEPPLIQQDRAAIRELQRDLALLDFSWMGGRPLNILPTISAARVHQGVLTMPDGRGPVA